MCLLSGKKTFQNHSSKAVKKTVRPSNLNVRAPSCFLVVFVKVANSPRTVRLSASTCPVGLRSVPTRHHRIHHYREAQTQLEVATPEWPHMSKGAKITKEIEGEHICAATATCFRRMDFFVLFLRFL